MSCLLGHPQTTKSSTCESFFDHYRIFAGRTALLHFRAAIVAKIGAASLLRSTSSYGEVKRRETYRREGRICAPRSTTTVTQHPPNEVNRPETSAQNTRRNTVRISLLVELNSGILCV
ncbi:unnamed protein product [Soboliphyme baturini]|uniref:Uncharacterized protein n=1 Tax=Soboliphyme baturini TaxID=241478 RepID=A0A183IYP7_9BILA|nr:unnamed protein product [Soboliphyme baturini]